MVMEHCVCICVSLMPAERSTIEPSQPRWRHSEARGNSEDWPAEEQPDVFRWQRTGDKGHSSTVPRTVPKLKWTGGCRRKTASLVIGPRLAIPPGFQFQFRRRERISSIGGFNSLRSCWEKQRATSLDSALKFPLS